MAKFGSFEFKPPYAPASKRFCSRLTLTRSPAQKPECKDPRCNGQNRAITSGAAYTPVSNRAGSRSQKRSVF